MNNFFKLRSGENNTPLFRLFNLEKKLNWRGQLWAKAEYQNPTGSFKDRGTIVEINQAIILEKKGVVCASTGNMAASLSAYAAKVLLPCVIFIPEKTPENKIKQAMSCQAKIITIKGVYDDCVVEAQKFAQKNNYLLCGDYELRRLGQSTIGIELANSKIIFDAFIVPVGNGTVGCAISQGFASFGQFPRFFGVQGQKADPIYQAWKNNTKIIPISNPTTIASAINVGNPLDGKMTLDWIQKTKGQMFLVSDQEITIAQKILVETEGIYVEKAAATTMAALIRFKNRKQNIVLILTGNGLKENF